jgi:preprotein translocase subunit SecE
MGTQQKAQPEAKAGSSASAPVKSPNRFIQFLQEVFMELKRTSWPSRTETVRSTLVVLAVMIIISTWIVLCDKVLTNVTQWLTELKK